MSSRVPDAALRAIGRVFAGGSAAGLADPDLLARFAAGRDEAAFAALVERHGPMVLSTCRRILGPALAAEADDAFQATFLVLARRAGSIRPADSLGPWLRGVAIRVARRARREAGRRPSAPSALEPAAPAGGADPLELAELRAVLAEELARLPERYRAPVVLCHLEGLTQAQAADRLGCPAGTVGVRLVRARDRLRGRLARRGLAPSAGALALAWKPAGARAEVPPALAEAARRLAAGGPIGASAAPAAAELARGAIRAMIRARALKLSAAALLLAAGAAIAARPPAGPPDEPPPAPKPAPTTPIEGLVVDERGEPAGGVQVFYSERDSAEGPTWGLVVAQDRTGADGRYRLEAPVGPKRFATLWAYRPGHLLGSRPVSRGMLPPGVPNRLAIGPPARTLIEVVDPDGRPVAGARIRPRVTHRDLLAIPDGLAERIEAESITGADGRAILTALLPEEVNTLFVAADGLGRQQVGFRQAGFREQGLASVLRVELSPVGAIEGRIVAEEPGGASGLDLTLWTFSPRQPTLASGHVAVTTDAEGRFRVDAIPAGSLRVVLREAGQAGGWYPDARPVTVIEPGQINVIEIPLRRGVRVRGVVRERGTENPIAGARVGFYEGPVAGTDEQGRFELVARPGQFAGYVGSPEGFAQRLYSLHGPDIRAGAEEIELPPIELSRSRSLRGRTLEAGGSPAAGAIVTASWTFDEGQITSRQGEPGTRLLGRGTAVVRADAVGAFVVDGIPVGVEVELAASVRGLRTAGPEVVPDEARRPIELHLIEGHSRSLAGRVVDTLGRPVAGAQVRIRSRQNGSGDGGSIPQPVDFDGVSVLLADEDGRFETPPYLDPALQYQALAEAEGFRVGETAWIDDTFEGFPDDLVLRRAP